MSEGPPAVRLATVDPQRTWWYDAFFAAWSFERVEDLLAAVRSAQLDPAAVARNRDLSIEGMSGWTYWFLYLKGYEEYAAAGRVDDANSYYRYLTESFEQDEGLIATLRDPEQARKRVTYRFRDLATIASGDGSWKELEPIRVWTRQPAPVDAKFVFEVGSDEPLPATDIDGYHRLFAARLHGLEGIPAEIVDNGSTGPMSERLRRIREVVRFTLPYDATVAVVHQDHEPLDLERRRTVEVGVPEQGWADVQGEIAGIRAKGCEYLLIPAGSIDQLERSGFDALGLRALAKDREACYLYDLDDQETDSSGLDLDERYPLPPTEMRLLSAGYTAADRFVLSGSKGLQWLSEIVAKHGAVLDAEDDVLDFGCGAGRYVRHLGDHDGRIVGIDYNPYLLAWTKGNLRFARFEVCGSRPPTAEPDASFGLIFAVDVFSHLDGSLQRPWFDELARLLRPGGLLVLTVHGASQTTHLPANLRRAFGLGDLAVWQPELSGTNACGAFHPKAYVERVFAERLPLVEFIQGGADDVHQDVAVFRKPTSGSE